MPGPIELRLKGEATPYFYIGDSHAMVGSLLFDAPGHETERLVTSVQLIRGFAARDMLGDYGSLGAAPVDVLRRISAFSSHPDYPPIDGLPLVHSTDGTARLEEHLTLTRFANERPYVFCVGEIDTRYLARWLVTDGVDVELPFAADGLEALPAFQSSRTYRADEFLRVLAQQFHPLFRGLRILHGAGLRSIFLHALVPPSTDDADAERVIGVRVPARLRYKLTMCVNYIFSVVCADIGIALIDTWKLVTKNNLLDPAYYLDGLHLNQKHVELSVAETHRQFTALRAASLENA